MTTRNESQPLMVEPPFRLDYFSRNQIERAVDQSARTRKGVKVEVTHGGEKFRILVFPLPDFQKRLKERAEGHHG
jgi:hypothetical protein